GVKPGEPGHDPAAVVATRQAELEVSCAALKVTHLELLGYADSGMMGWPTNDVPGSFWSTPVDEAAARLAAILTEERAAALVGYDARGIYGHADHVQVHRVGARAAAVAGVATVYESTVDREYLHFVETHLVVEATLAAQPERAVAGLGLAAAPLGLSTVEVDCTVDVRPVLTVKRRAMAAHASQIPETSSAMRLPDADFAAVYGYEWYARRGPHGPIDELL
ncbi:MAG TPA: PIG-L family deacetylase, partial [Acidimicrobiia bacterium]|nr:PIG-L family deacetylase [Acidimicrobiia bacterium]